MAERAAGWVEKVENCIVCIDANAQGDDSICISNLRARQMIGETTILTIKSHCRCLILGVTSRGCKASEMLSCSGIGICRIQSLSRKLEYVKYPQYIRGKIPYEIMKESSIFSLTQFEDLRLPTCSRAKNDYL